MFVRLAKEIVRQWVVAEASRMAGFRGAFYHGSINWLSDGDALPVTSDVDVMIVVDGPSAPEKLGKLIYQGVIIEASYLSADEIRSAEQVLGLSHLAGSLRANSVIADPTGQLSVVQAGVARDYAKREWVTRRCEHAVSKVRQHLQGLVDAPFQARPFHDQVMAWLFGTGVTTHILLTAGLWNPTVRKRYLDARELLAQYGRSDFYETLLDLLGCARMSRVQVEEHLANLSAVFDTARAVIRSPFPFAADISANSRPVAIDGSRELIERGSHREAVFWIAATYSRCMKVLALDGEAGMLERYDPGYRALMADLGIHSFADLQRRSRQVLESLPRVWEVAEEIMAANPEIVSTREGRLD